MTTTTDRTMKCPSCDETMRPISYEGVAVHTCDACGGEFIGPAEMAHIIAAREQRFTPELDEAMGEFTPIFGLVASETERLLDCPVCETPMTVINFGGDTGVHVDRCGACQGLWLDLEELEKVQILMERWQDAAPAQLGAIAADLEIARRRAVESARAQFGASRFSFVNALINRLLDAA